MYRKNPNDLLPEPVSGPLRAVYQPAQHHMPDRLEDMLGQIRQKYANARQNYDLHAQFDRRASL